MHYLVSPGGLRGNIQIPSSKSHSLRAILFGMLGKGTTVIHHYLPSNDVFAMIEACRHLGAHIEVKEHSLIIKGLDGCIQGADDVIQAGNSGIVLRFISAIAALGSQSIVVTGDRSARQRPMEQLLRGLEQLGTEAISLKGNGCAPVMIKGPFKPGSVRIEGSDSQPVSSLLIAAAMGCGPVTLTVENPGEKPWVAMTLSWFDRLGIAYQNREFSSYFVSGGSRFAGFDYSVPGDLSSAAFPVVAALVTRSELILENVDLTDVQGDKKFFSILQQMGAPIEVDIGNRRMHVKPLRQALQGISIDINDCVDAIAALAVAACYAEGVTEIRNAAVARTKECNRIHCLATELRKMGSDITELEDGLQIRFSTLKGAELNSHGDHRLAMSLTTAALGAKGQSKINDVGCISKTYPEFYSHFKQLGASIELR